MGFSRMSTLCAAVSLTCISPVLAWPDTRAKADSAKRPSWKEAAKKQLAAEDVEALEKNKVLMTNEAFKQVFSAYLSPGFTTFITSDSVLNAYHVLFEESVYLMERANARILPEILRFGWGNLGTVDAGLKGKPELVAASKFRAQAVIGVALKLLGDESIKVEGKLAKAIDEEVKHVVVAEGRGKPAWLGPPDEGFLALDYSRYRPRGFYTSSPRLECYFRAVSWLQSIPFRVEKDEELLAALMLGGSFAPGGLHRHGDFRHEDFSREYDAFFRCFGRLLGTGEDWDVRAAGKWAGSGGPFKLDLPGGELAKKREGLLEDARRLRTGSSINDQLRFLPDDAKQAAQVNFRILPAKRLPDSALFVRTTDLGKSFPSGLEVAAAIGSPFARSYLARRDGEKLLSIIDASKPLFAGDDLYRQYLLCVAALFAEPEPDAPAFMRGEAWKSKSCQTALAGWAQLRHTWVLQAGENANWNDGNSSPPGFIEANPEFFARMARLAADTEAVLREAGAFEFDVQRIAETLRSSTKELKDTAYIKKSGKLKLSEARISGRVREEVQAHMTLDFILSLLREDSGEIGDVSILEVLNQAEKLADRIEKGELKYTSRIVRGPRDPYIPSLWQKLERVCHRLEALAHKQLRLKPFSKDEEDFIGEYGETLAGIMLYGGNSYLTPHDDAPRIVDVFTSPLQNKVLEVGVARPRAVYVLYPVPGGEVLCRGAVLPYYEFPHASRLTDPEWKKLLDSKDRPEVPPWVRPLLGREGLKAPKVAN